jgi:serine/threonine protein kinase
MNYECPQCGQSRRVEPPLADNGKTTEQPAPTCPDCNAAMVAAPQTVVQLAQPPAPSPAPAGNNPPNIDTVRITKIITRTADPEPAPDRRTVWIDIPEVPRSTEPVPDKNRSMTITQFMADGNLQGGVCLDEVASRVLTDDVRGRKYKLGDTVAEGGMGTILGAWDRNLRRHIAMKVLLRSRRSRKDHVLRFIEEAQVTSQLEHPSIIPVHELAINDEGDVFYTMKFLKGRTLGDILRSIRDGDRETIKAYPLSHLLTILQKTCDAIAFAHSKHVIHRDVKPDNIMVGDYGEVQVMDWGLAKVLAKRTGASTASGAHSSDEPAPHATSAEAPAGQTAINSVRKDAGADILNTVSGSIMGTPGYMAPEQAKGKTEELDERADIYSLGSILYAILTLRPPVQGGDLTDFITQVTAGAITSPVEFGKKGGRPTPDGTDSKATGTAHKPEDKPLSHLPDGQIPESLSAVAMKALALDPAQRYQDVKELQRDIEAYQDGFATQAEQAGFRRQLALFVRRNRAVSLAVATALAILLLVVGGAWRINAAKKREALQARAERAEQASAAAEARLALFESEKKAKEDWIPVGVFDFNRAAQLDDRFETVVCPVDLLYRKDRNVSPVTDGALITNGCLRLKGVVGLMSLRWKGDVGDDMQLECVVSGTHNIGLAVGGDSFQGYRAIYDSRLGILELDTIRDAVWTTLAINREPLKPADKRHFRMEKSGSSIRVWVDGELVIDYFDPLILSGTPYRTFALSTFYTDALVYSMKVQRRRSPEVVSCLEAGRELIRRHRLDDASDFLRTQIQTHGQTEIGVEARLLLGICLSQQDRTDEALAMLRSVAETTDDRDSRLRITAFQQISTIHFSMGRFQEAAQFAREAWTRDPSSSAVEQTQQALLSCLRRLKRQKGLSAPSTIVPPLGQTQAEVLRALSILPTKRLDLMETDITDLSPLKGMNLSYLRCTDGKLQDLTPLDGMRLIELEFSPDAVTNGLDILRNMKSLIRINQTAAEDFWKQFDRKNAPPRTKAHAP